MKISEYTIEHAYYGNRALYKYIKIIILSQTFVAYIIVI